MLTLNDEGIVIEEDWSWPVSIVSISDDSYTLFWLVWCGKDKNCNCIPSLTVGVGNTKHKALESWRFKHFVETGPRSTYKKVGKK